MKITAELGIIAGDNNKQDKNSNTGSKLKQKQKRITREQTMDMEITNQYEVPKITNENGDEMSTNHVDLNRDVKNTLHKYKTSQTKTINLRLS